MTRALAALVLQFALALWLGGLVWLFATVSQVFAIDRAVAIRVAPAFFNAFNRYQLVLGGIAVVAAVVMWRSTRRRGWIIPVASAVTALIVVGVIFYVTSKLEGLREAGLSGGQTFRDMHGTSMVLYLTATALVTVALGAASWITNRRKDDISATRPDATE
jgi:hypothetical protein